MIMNPERFAWGRGGRGWSQGSWQQSSVAMGCTERGSVCGHCVSSAQPPLIGKTQSAFSGHRSTKRRKSPKKEQKPEEWYVS